MANSSKTTAPEGMQMKIKEGEPLKDYLNHDSLYECALMIKSLYNLFPVDVFLNLVFDDTWNSLELKARWRKIALGLGQCLPADYGEALSIIDKVVEEYASDVSPLGISFQDFIEIYGQDEADWDLSMATLERFTVYWSAEFAVRSFILNNEKRMMAQMLEWSKHENEHVRRLSSEGCRPALPWGQALKSFKKDPSPIVPILEQLKNDPSLFVRKSVANNLNDISKTHPDLVIGIAKDWQGSSVYTDWIIKHACRSMLRKGNRKALALFGYDDGASIKVNNFIVKQKDISIGDNLDFSFAVKVSRTTKIRLEYAIDFVKSNGKRSKKVFQISELSLKVNEKKTYTKKHSFKNLTTRKHYPGTHTITLIVNGIERTNLDFELKA